EYLRFPGSRDRVIIHRLQNISMVIFYFWLKHVISDIKNILKDTKTSRTSNRMMWSNELREEAFVCQT
ncbi:MAG: hypothetical protein ACLRV8_12430, partial [Blautia hansenii]